MASLKLIESLAYTTKESFQPVSGIYLKPVLRLSSRAKKVYVTLSRATLIRVIEFSACSSFLPVLNEAMASPSKSLRETAAIGILTLCKSCKEEQVVKYKTELENFLKNASVDQLQTVREYSKSVWEVYKTDFPNTYHIFANTLSFTSKKYLSIPLNTSSTTPKLSMEATHQNTLKNVPPTKRICRRTTTLTKNSVPSIIPKGNSSTANSCSLSGVTSLSSNKSQLSSKHSSTTISRCLSNSFSSSSLSTALSTKSTLSSSRSFIQSFRALKANNTRNSTSELLKSRTALPLPRPSAASCGLPFKVVRPSGSAKL